MSEQPIPPSIWARIVAFMAANRYGKIELDVKAGRVVGCRIIETVQVEDADRPLVQLRETG